MANDRLHKNQPTHNKGMAKKFLASLDPTAEKHAFQLINGSGCSRIYHLTLEEFWPTIEAGNTAADGWEVFVLPNGNGQLPPALFASANDNEQVDRARTTIKACGAKADMVIIYGDHAQLIYLCPGIPSDQFPVLQGRLSARLGTDPAIASLQRMRLPGTLYLQDPAAPKRVELLQNGAAKNWKLDELFGRLELKQKPSSEPNSVPAAFLQKLRPGGPWVLTAIVPDGGTTTITATTADQVDTFVRQHDGKRNLYYSVNPTRTVLNSKAKKADIAAIEYVLGDLDPKDDETSEAAKARYLAQLNGAFEPKPTAAVDSGNGIQVLMRLQESIILGELVDGKFSAEDQAKIDDVEARATTLMKRLGAKAGTQNIDRILRLPGTTNLPNAKKRRDGRTECPTSLLWFNGASYPLDAFPKEEQGKKKSDERRTAGRERDTLWQEIRESVEIGKRSEAVWAVVNKMLRRGYRAEAIVQVLLDRKNGISEHIYDQAKPDEYAARQVEQAIEKLEFICNQDGKITPIHPANIRIALCKLGVRLRHNQFADHIIVEGMPGFGPVLQDPALNRVWLQFMDRLKFFPKIELTRIVMEDVAQTNAFHPVREYLDSLKWDGVPRLDGWLTTYAGAEDNEYTRAVGSIALIAAVRRIRAPGCKFDEMLIFEQPTQGTDKSTAIRIMAVRDEWYADDLPLSADSRRVIEYLRGKWIVEIPELVGMRNTGSDHLKSQLSHQSDRARLAWARLPVEAQRQNIFIGTINKIKYLRDTTGNRRYWPVRVVRFDLDALRRDRDQLWAEAAAREATGDSIRLAPKLWPDAATEQEERLADDPFVAILDRHLGHLKGRIRAADVWEILDLRGAQLNQDIYARAAEAMKRLGWERPNKAGIAKFDGRPMAAYVRGDRQKTIEVKRDKDGLHITTKDDDAPEVQALLSEMLKDGKAVPQQEIKQAAKAKGFTDKQLRAARHNLSVTVIKGDGGDLCWCLPNPDAGRHYYE
jgi:predicted P-loop ATPase